MPGNARTFELGEPGAPTVVLPGLPVNADTWAPVVTALGEARAADLPCLGMSEGDRDDWPSWLAALVTKTGARHLVGHSIGAAAAVEAAAAHPDAAERLTLVAPFFLQARSASVPRLPARWYLGRVSARALAERLPRAEVTVIPDAGHHPRLTHLEEVAHAVAGDAPPRVREPFSPSGRSARSRG
ncbi:alpha/beta fold hydrolase [Microbispora hainanensis]|uniref:alpha/beta fold hydrolase n=1 Tax=Microbispora hainanensis TaxID=568844 RepID=UPI003AF382CD